MTVQIRADLAGFDAAMQRLRTGAQTTTQAIGRNFSTLQQQLTGFESQVRRSFGRDPFKPLGDSAKKSGSDITSLGRNVRNFSSAARLAILPITALAGAVTALGAATIPVAQQFIALERALIISGLGLEETGERIEEMTTFANRLGVSVLETIGTIRRLTLAAQGTSLAGRPVQELAENFLTLSSAAGLTEDEINRASIQIGQILALGRLQGDEAVRLAEATGLNFTQAISRVLGVGQAEFLKLQSQGRVSSLAVARAIEEMAANAQTNLEAVGQSVESPLAEFNRLRNDITLTSAAIGRQLIPVLNDAARFVRNLLLRFQDFTENSEAIRMIFRDIANDVRLATEAVIGLFRGLGQGLDFLGDIGRQFSDFFKQLPIVKRFFGDLNATRAAQADVLSRLNQMEDLGLGLIRQSTLERRKQTSATQELVEQRGLLVESLREEEAIERRTARFRAQIFRDQERAFQRAQSGIEGIRRESRALGEAARNALANSTEIEKAIRLTERLSLIQDELVMSKGNELELTLEEVRLRTELEGLSERSVQIARLRTEELANQERELERQNDQIDRQARSIVRLIRTSDGLVDLLRRVGDRLIDDLLTQFTAGILRGGGAGGGGTGGGLLGGLSSLFQGGIGQLFGGAGGGLSGLARGGGANLLSLGAVAAGLGLLGGGGTGGGFGALQLPMR